MIGVLLSLVMVAMLCSCEPEVDGPDSPTTPTTPDTPTMPDNTVVCGETVGEWVDLGLPSGLLWYSVNIGATSPEEYGCYFAWGETQAKEEYIWSTYSYCTVDADGRLSTFTKYDTVDNKTVLEASDDVATVVLGTGARIPTYDDWHELWSNITTVERTEQNGVNGMKITAANGQSLFLPAAGYFRDGSSLYGAGSVGSYWSSSLCWPGSINAASIGFNPAGGPSGGGCSRHYGFSVRAVRAIQN